MRYLSTIVTYRLLTQKLMEGGPENKLRPFLSFRRDFWPVTKFIDARKLQVKHNVKSSMNENIILCTYFIHKRIFIRLYNIYKLPYYYEYSFFYSINYVKITASICECLFDDFAWLTRDAVPGTEQLVWSLVEYIQTRARIFGRGIVRRKKNISFG